MTRGGLSSGTRGGAPRVMQTVATTAPTTPTIQSAVVENSSPTDIVVTFNQSIDTTATPPASAFSLAAADTRTITGTAVAPTNRLTVTVDAPYTSTDAITLSYTQQPSLAADGGLIASFTDRAVTNNVAAAAASGISLSGLTATDTLLFLNSGQSNAQRLYEQHLSTTFTTDFGADFNGSSLVIANSALGDTGFRNGTTEWIPGDTLATNLVNAINAAKATSTHVGPLIWWQGENDSTTAFNVSTYADQVINLHDYVREQTELELDWIIVRLNPVATGGSVNVPNDMIAAQNAMIASMPNFYLADIDAFTPGDGLHYDGQYETIFDTVIQPVIDTNNLIKAVSSVSFTYVPTTGGGIALDHTFAGTDGDLITTLTPTVGTGFTQVLAGNLEVDNTGSRVGASGSAVNPERWFVGGVDTPVGEIVSIRSTVVVGNTSRVGAVAFRYGGNSELRYVNLTIDEVGAVDFQIRSESTLASDPGISLPSVPVDPNDRYFFEIEHNGYEIRYRVNGGTVTTFFNSTYPTQRNGAARILGSSNYIEDYVVEGLTAFTLV